MGATEILVVMLVAIALTLFAEKHRLQAPLLLVLVGLAVSFVPGLAKPQLSPETILGIVVPPLLYSAALDFSFFSFIKRIGSILNLSVALVVVTTGAIGLALGWLMPSLGLAGALVLGAAVAPPDAVSAVAIGRQLGLPSRLMTILQGESLINDAAALALFGVAVGMATGVHQTASGAALFFLYAALAGAAIGIALGALLDRVRRRMDNPTLVTTLAILVPFTAYALAERVEASGVMSVVFAGFTLSHRSADLGFAGRIQEREVWRVVDKLLETFAFAYMGLQLRFLIEDARQDGFDPLDLAFAAAAVLAVAVLVRGAWIGLTACLGRLRFAARRNWATHDAGVYVPPEPLSWAENLVLSWSGMRGVVTLAAAAGTPVLTAAGAPLAGRSAIVLMAFGVAVGSLMLHGMTLPWLVRQLRLPGDDAQALHAHRLHARSVMRQTTRSARTRLRDEKAGEAEIAMAESLLADAERGAQAAEGLDGDNGAASPRRSERELMLKLAFEILSAQRVALIAERDAQRLDDEVLREMLEGLDLKQALLAKKSEAWEQLSEAAGESDARDGAAAGDERAGRANEHHGDGLAGGDADGAHGAARSSTAVARERGNSRSRVQPAARPAKSAAKQPAGRPARPPARQPAKPPAKRATRRTRTRSR